MAWMAMFAIWLSILAPVASRAMPAASAFPELGAWCEGRAGLVDHAQPDGHDIGHMDACGYCTLLAQNPTVGTVAFVAHLLPLSGFVAATLPVKHGIDAPLVLHAPPRGPPRFANV
ncbi:DUF2946 family protein [Luteibacter rhizovicinus]|uniref:DUF2946 family protein n=2 Tax=Luteibacter rhizovicinus TaxID=242606 RepID=A0A4R3YTT6_9GAMM|nr:DUF2946 family protein [Luteibacter rhizovicinus]